MQVSFYGIAELNAQTVHDKTEVSACQKLSTVHLLSRALLYLNSVQYVPL